jgi:RHS repeat-associated protein
MNFSLKKLFSENRKIEMFPVLVPIILSLCSWTFYKVGHKDKVHERNAKNHLEYVNPFKIDCGFLNHSPKVDKTRSNEIADISFFPGTKKDSVFSAEPAVNKDQLRGSVGFPEESFLTSNLVSSGYIGQIGNKNGERDVDASDNIFDIYLGKILSGKSYTLKYEVEGYSDISSVTRSINGSFAVGGYIKYKKSGWSEVSENIDAGLLKKGNNTILFNSLGKGDYYHIKNVRIIENKTGLDKAYEIVSKVYTDKVFYIRGYVNPSAGITSVDILGEKIALKGNEFEYLSIGKKENLSIPVKFLQSKNSVLEETIRKNISEEDYISSINSYRDLESNIIHKDASYILSGVRTIDLPPTELSTVNVSAGFSGFSFKNKTSQSTTVNIPFDKTILPKGFTEQDITVFNFDYKQKKWIQTPIDSVNTVKNYIVLHTSLKQAYYIAGVSKQPESPETGAEAPTGFDDMPIANPGSKINLIAPPTPNQQGSANIQYPIEIPAGIGGFQPTVSLVYNSDNKFGWAGTGWDVPVESIDIDTRWGIPSFNTINESEIYMISGEQLVFKDDYLPNKVPYPEVRAANRIFYYRNGIKEGYTITRKGSSPSTYTWEILDGSGTKKEYLDVLTNNPANNTSGNIVKWYLTKVTDRFGNTITYTYVDTYEGGGKNKYLSKIAYSNNTLIEFENEAGVRPDMIINNKLGVKLSDPKILRKITVKRANTIIREYHLDNTLLGQFSKRLLKEIVQKDGSGNVFNKHVLSYNTSAAIFEKLPTKVYNTPKDNNDVGSFSGANTSFIGGSYGKNKNIRGSLSFGWGFCVVAGKNKRGTLGLTASYDDNRSYGKNQLIDMDGDGLLDKAFYAPNGLISFRKNGKTSFGSVYSSIGLPNETPIFRSNAYNTTLGLEYSFKKGVVGLNYSWGKSNSPTYFSDVNGDGLVDMINYGEVFFGKIRNGGPQFKSQPATGTVNVTEETPNAILEGSPAVMDTIDTEESSTSPANIVRMWEAPVSGDIIINNNISLSQNSQDGVDVWIERGGMTKANENNSGFIPSNSIQISSTATLISQGQSQTLSASTHVEKGQRIFIIASSKANPVKDKVNIITDIQYTSVLGVADLTVKDANNNYYYKFNSSTHYLASSKKDNVIGEKGKVKISWNTLSGQTFTDDVDFKIYKSLQSVSDTTGIATPSTLIYHHKLPKGVALNTVVESDNLIANSDISNLLVNQNPSDSTMTLLHFDVSSDTNISWEKIKWRPEMTIMSDTDTTAVKALVQYNPYSERLTNTLPLNFTKYSGYDFCSDVFCPYPRCCIPENYYLFPDFNSDHSYFNNHTINLSTPHNTKVTFSLKIRDYNGVIYTTKETVDVVNNLMPIPKIEICSFFSTIPLPPDQLYQLPFYFEISSPDYEVAKKLASLNPFINNSAFSGNMALVTTKNKADYFAYRSDNIHYNTNTGLVYQGWGGFSYNGSKYPNAAIRESEFNANTTSNIPQPGGASPCNPSAPDYYTCMVNYISQQNNNRYFTPLDLDAESEAYVSPLESAELTGDYLQPFMLGVSSGSQSVTQTPVFAVPNPRGIILRSKSDGLHLYAAGSITPWLGISAHGGFSTDKTSDYFQDFNGDQYPDIISGNLFQKTNLLGQLTAASGTDKKEIKNKGLILGAGLSASPSIAKFSNNTDVFFYVGGEKDMHTGSSSFALGVGANVTIGKAWAQGNGVWADMNGDGLMDYVSEGNVYLNNGTGFTYDPYGWSVSEVSKSDSFAVSGGGGYSMANGSWAGGVGLSKSSSTAKVGLIDVNGDGLADKIVKNGNTYEIWINNGTSFISPNNFNKDFSLENKQNSSGRNFFGTLCACLGLKICLSGGFGTDKSVNKQEVDLRDFDGDGYPDLLVSNKDTELTYYHNNLPQANLLLRIENTLQGAIQINYNNVNEDGNIGSLVGGTYQMPFSKTVMSEVALWNFRPLDTTLPITNGVNDPQKVKPREKFRFEYEKGVHDRREREFLGFGVVKTKVLNDAAVHQTHVTEYETDYTGNENNFFVNYNDTKVRQYFYKKGLVRSTYMLDSQNRKRSETKNIYRYFDQSSSSGYQLSENQAEPLYKDIGRIIPLLYKTESSFTEYSGNNSHTKTTLRTVDSYDKYGNVTQSTDRGVSMSNALDDIKMNVSYHNPGAKNIVGTPSEQTVTAGGQLVRKSTTELDAAQNIKKIKKYLGTQTADFDMEYDTYGNLTKVTQPLSASGQRMFYTYSYDPVYHTYLVATGDAYGYTSSTQYDNNYLFGVPVSVTDINGVTSEYKYDSFGRLIQYRSPLDGDWTIKMYYYPSDVMPVAVTERKAPVVNGNAPAVNYFSSLFSDGWGEGLMIKKLFKQESGTYYFANNIYQIKDKLGRPVKTIIRDKVTTGTNIMTSLRKFDDYLTSEDQAAQIYTSTAYDELDRPVTITQNNVVTNNGAQNLVTKIFYEFGSDRNGLTQFSTRTESPLGNTSISYTDEKGRTTAGKQTGGGQDIWVSYGYDLLGQLIEIDDAGYNPTKYIYDMLGRKVSVQQPDAGTSTFEYDLSGKMVSSQNAVLNANGQQVNYRYHYDQLTSVTYPSHTVSFEYGAPGAANYAAGRLVKQTDRTGTQVFKYTPVGQVKENTRIIVAPQNVPKMFKTSFVYDALGRINKITYPDTEEVLYNYNMAGLLDNIYSKLPGEPEPRPIAYSMTYNNRDEMMSYYAGNGTRTIYQYDPWGKTKELSLLNNTGGNIRKNMYSFDGNGNVANINGVTPMTGNYPSSYIAVATQKNFSYDSFGRLESAQILAKGNQNTKYYTLNMKYNDVGNMDVKDFGLKTYLNNGGCQYPVNEGDIGNYIYKDPNHPNAVSSIVYDKFKDFTSPLDCGSPTADPRTEGQEDFSYDLNGNLIAIHEKYAHGNNFGQYRNLFWDEQNRLKAVVTQKQNLNYYVYDAGGERILKNDAVSKKLYVNGNNPDETTQMGPFIYYPNGYLVLSDKTMSKHYYMGSQRIATRVSQVPSHRFKINLAGEYDDLANAIYEDIKDIINQAGLPPDVWVPNEDSQGTYTPPVSNIGDPNVCAYIIEQQIIAFEEDHNDRCKENLLSMYETAVSSGQNICDVWNEFLHDECMTGYNPPEIVESEMYWIHPDHLGGASILVNSGGKVTNWYEYMPYGEMLMELSNQDYNNPYKYNGKEFDEATGYYYYGARYYDPKRSFWISVDPLAEITQSPYTYVWNDPVNYIDPTGMMGERVGGRPKDWYRDRLGNVSWHDSQDDEIIGKNGEKLTRLGKEGSYINIKGSTTQLNRNHTVTEDGKTSFVVKPSQMSASSMAGSDAPQVSSPGKPKTYFSSFDTDKYYEPEPHAASGFHPTLTDPSASIMKGYIEAEAGGYLFRGFKGILFYDAEVQWTKVGHWCPRESYNIMSETGHVVPEQGGLTFFSTAGPESWAAAPKGWVYSEMEIQSNSLIKAGTEDWLKAVHSESAVNGQSQIRAVLKKGGQLTPPIRNLTPILKTKL